MIAYVLRASDPLFQCKKHYTLYFKVVFQVGRFLVNEGGDGVRQVGVMVNE